VAIVGAGAVAQALGRLMVAAGEPVVALAGRTRERAELAARFISAPAEADGSAASIQVVEMREVPGIASRVLIAVADEGIGPVAGALAAAGFRSGVALHTCGARGPDALKALQDETIMTPEQGVQSLPDVTFGVCGDQEAIAWALQIVTALNGRLLQIDADRLSYYHAGAVMASNAVMAALDAAVALFAQAGIDRDEALRAVAPLARASVDNAIASGPHAALTGPVARGDASTVAAHVRALQTVDPTVARLYLAAAEHLVQLAKRRGLPEERARAIELAMKG
jgi:predicted short-subunit dehydrogenase-like oxidoreductase (DUF2520 family)